jgi:3-hydroxyisobutyrate dehydrogenase-like beta-hydroxyacid dehydrogenase
MTHISILGCGWLGLPLAKALLENGISINGSTTSIEKLSVLENSGIQPHLIALESNNVSGNIETFLQGSKTLIIDNSFWKIKNYCVFIARSKCKNK